MEIPQRVLLTGANGFVGRYMQACLPCISLADAQGTVDIRDAARIEAAVRHIQPDAVVHLAAQSFVPESFKNPLEAFNVNFFGTFNLLHALKSVGFGGRMLFVGSGDMYGLVAPEALPVTESQPLRPRNPYAVSKVAAEALCYQWSQTEGFDIVMARPFNHIGPGQSARFAVADFARQIVEIKRGQMTPVLNVGDIDVTRDFTDVRDVARVYALLLSKGLNGVVYNVCTGLERSLRGMIEQLLKISGVTASIEQEAARLRPSEQRRIVGSNARLVQDTAWQPELSLEQSLRDLLDYWERELE